MTPVIQPVDQYKQLGNITISLGEILVNGSVETTLLGGVGDIKIEVVQESVGRGILTMLVAFVSMPKDHWLMKNYPQLAILKQNVTNQEWEAIFGTEVIQRSDAGEWDPISLPCKLLCDSDYSRVIRLLVQDAEPNHEVTPIGYVDIPVKTLGEARNLRLTLIPCNRLMARAGSIIIRAGTIVQRLTFYGQIKRGLRFRFACAIDYSTNNRPPRDPKSYHYSSQNQKSPYEVCIQSIGGIIEHYSTHQLCLGWGFGARKNRNLVNDIPITDETGSRNIRTIAKLLNAYSSFFDTISFDKTVFVCPVTLEALKLVKNKSDNKEYLVFLIMVTEDPLDLTQFRDLLYENQNEPISIIMIGIGDNDFPQSEEIFKPKNLKNAEGRPFERDIVTFIKYNKFGSENIRNLVIAALTDIPDQAIYWIEMNST